MPYINVPDTHCLYVAPGDTEEQRFEKQCEIIIQWQTRQLSPLQLLDLPANFTQAALKTAKMKQFLRIHPDKNNNSAYSVDAFKVLSNAGEFLAHQLDPTIDIGNNPFDNQDDNPSQHTAPEPKHRTTKTRPTPPPVSADKKAYLNKLSELAKATTPMTPDDEQFFRNALAKHPEYLPLAYTKHNLFHFVLETGSPAFFQWLTTQRYAEETIAKSKDNYDFFSCAFDSQRKDCLRILLETYGKEALHASSIQYSLSTAILLFDDESQDRKEMFFFLFDELGYTPTNGYVAVSVLDAALGEVDLPTFHKIHDQFKHLLVDPEQPYNYNALISEVLTFSWAKRKMQMMAEAGLMPFITDPLFQNIHKLDVFLSQNYAMDMIHYLQEKYNLMRNIGIITPDTIQRLCRTSVITLLNAAFISVEDILSGASVPYLFQGENLLLSQALLNKNKADFSTWLNSVEFTPEYLKSQLGQAQLRFMLKNKVDFSTPQLAVIQSAFDAYFTALAGRQKYTDHDNIFLPHHDEVWLTDLIESLGTSPNGLVYLNKVYDQELSVVIQYDGSHYNANDTHFKTYKFTETILTSFTPLQFFMIMNKQPLAILLLSQGVDWKQAINFTKQTGINNPSHPLYNPNKWSRDHGYKADDRCVTILSSNPDLDAQIRIIDSKNIIFISKDGQIEIGFCNTDYEYEQKVVSGVDNIITLVRQALPAGKITNKANLDAIEQYMTELGICLYSSEYTQSTVLDYVRSEIEGNEYLRLLLNQSFPNNVTAQNAHCDDLSKGAKAVLKQIQLNEAKSYLAQRTLGADYKTSLSFFGCFTIMNFGFSKQEKVTAVGALIAYLNEGTPIPESCRPALYQGELGKIAALREVDVEVHGPQANPI